MNQLLILQRTCVKQIVIHVKDYLSNIAINARFLRNRYSKRSYMDNFKTQSFEKEPEKRKWGSRKGTLLYNFYMYGIIEN